MSRAYSAVNDQDCGWLHLLDNISEFTNLKQTLKADWLIIGGGYTGLAAAHRLAQLRPEDKTILLDAEGIAQGASARNSGFIVDSTLNDGQASHAAEKGYRLKYGLNLEGIAQLEQQLKQFNIQCDWDAAGKYHSAVAPKHFKKLESFSTFLNQLEISHTLLDKTALSKSLGTEHYGLSVHTTGGVLINPAALVMGLANALMQHYPSSVSLYSHSPVISIHKKQGGFVAKCPTGQVSAKNILIACNAFMPRMGLQNRRVFPLTLSGGLTRRLSQQELDAIGNPRPWGVLSVHPMGATVRLTHDRRIMLRNTVQSIRGMKLSKAQYKTHQNTCLQSILKRFPMLQDIKLAHYWAGNVCISRNNKPIFERFEKGLYMAGCYNAGGIAMGSLFGRRIVDYALGDDSPSLNNILCMEKANTLPPQPFASIGLKASLAWRRQRGQSEA